MNTDLVGHELEETLIHLRDLVSDLSQKEFERLSKTVPNFLGRRTLDFLAMG
jgi:hypothetical protein